MKTMSIYTQDRTDMSRMAPADKIACYASELKTIYDLKLLGYTTSNGQQLDARAEELEQAIAQLEHPGAYNVKR